MGTEEERAARLLEAQASAVTLFEEITRRGTIAAEAGEQAVSDQIRDLANEKIDGELIESYIAPGNTNPMRRHDKAGRQCHWILEIHLVDAARRFGGFYEQLLGLG
jgi:hypothetical protein